jgi:hypothetical protein
MNRLLYDCLEYMERVFLIRTPQEQPYDAWLPLIRDSHKVNEVNALLEQNMSVTMGINCRRPQTEMHQWQAALLRIQYAHISELFCLPLTGLLLHNQCQMAQPLWSAM